jgi:hypothetical protein
MPVGGQRGHGDMLRRWLGEGNTQQPYDMIGEVRVDEHAEHASAAWELSETGAEAGSHKAT